MPESESFRLRYDGPALDSHEIEIGDLAPALLGVSDLINEANSIVNEGKARISIKVKATEPGSFMVAIVAQQSLLDQAITMFSGQGACALANLMQYIGFFGGGASVFAIIKFLKGRQAKNVIESNNGSTLVIENSEGESIEVLKPVWEIVNSNKARKGIQAIVNPLAGEGIDAVEFVEGRTVTRIDKQERVLGVLGGQATILDSLSGIVA